MRLNLKESCSWQKVLALEFIEEINFFLFPGEYQEREEHGR